MLWSVALVFATIVIGGAFDAIRRLPDLEPWHRVVPGDFKAADLRAQSTFDEYLKIEAAAFQTVYDRVEQSLDPTFRASANRYNSDSSSYPARFGTDSNRTSNSRRQAQWLAERCWCTA